jgi:hypothetical protein
LLFIEAPAAGLHLETKGFVVFIFYTVSYFRLSFALVHVDNDNHGNYVEKLGFDVNVT